MELSQLQDAEEGGADGAVSALTRAGLPSLPSDAQTTEDTFGLTDNLPKFQLVPKNPDGTLVLSGEELLKHMSTYANQNVEGYEGFGGPTPALDIHISKCQMECIQLTNDDLRKGRIIANAGGEGAIPKIENWKLDSLGYIQGHCGLLTEPGRMTRVENMIRLVASIYEIKRIKDAALDKSKDKHATKMKDLATNA